MRRARRAVVFTAAALIASVGAIAPAGAGKFGDVVAATVPPGSQLSPQGHYYLIGANPGDTATQNFRVTNPNDHPVTVMIEAVDATTGDLTGVQLARPGSAKALTSRWIVVSSPEITLAPNQQRDVPFTVHVPANVKPGQYLAGMSASVPLSAADTKANQAPAGRAGFSMAVRFQRGIAVEVDIPGPRSPNLAVSGAEPKATPEGVSLGVHIANDGNAFARGNGVIRVVDTNTDFSFKIDTFVPRTAIVFPMQWTKGVVPGAHHVEVDLTYDGGRRTSWTGTVVIAGDAQNQLQDALRNVTVHGHGSGAGLLLMLAVALIVVLVAAAVMMRRRGRPPRPVNYRAA
jgi:WxL Interacting Protein, peptidoglycan binding domain